MRQDHRSGGRDPREVPPAPPLIGGRSSLNGSSAREASRIPPFVSGRGFTDEGFEEGEGESTAFPLDAFFVPEDTERVPMGMDPARSGQGLRGRPPRHGSSDPAHRPDAVASRLEELASGLRTGGASAAALWAADPDPLRRALGEALGRFFDPADR